MDKLKAISQVLIPLGSVLWALITIMQCAHDTENYQRAVQALGELAFSK